MCAPAECPITNTRSGSPPYAAMWSRTHATACAPSSTNSGNPDIRVDAIVRNHGDVAPAGQRLAGEAIVLPVATSPSAAIEEHDDGSRTWPALRHVDVEPLPRVRPIGDVAIGAPAAARDHQIVEHPQRRARGEKRKCHDCDRSAADDNAKARPARHLHLGRLGDGGQHRPAFTNVATRFRCIGRAWMPVGQDEYVHARSAFAALSHDKDYAAGRARISADAAERHPLN